MSSMSSEAHKPSATYFRPERTHVLATVLMAGIALIGISWAPLALGWLLIIPIIFVVWVFKAHTRVDSNGVSTSYLFRKNVSVPWKELEGVGFKGSRAFASTTNGDKVYLPGITFNSLPRLEAASGGMIPDVLTAGLASVDGKVSVISKDGRQVLMTQEEHAEYERAKNANSPGSSPHTSTSDSHHPTESPKE